MYLNEPLSFTWATGLGERVSSLFAVYCCCGSSSVGSTELVVADVKAEYRLPRSRHHNAWRAACSVTVSRVLDRVSFE